MRELTTVWSLQVTGRGTAHYVYVGDESPELHEHVLLDGTACEVVGVEWPIRRGYTPILVKAIEK